MHCEKETKNLLHCEITESENAVSGKTESICAMPLDSLCIVRNAGNAGNAGNATSSYGISVGLTYLGLVRKCWTAEGKKRHERKCYGLSNPTQSTI